MSRRRNGGSAFGRTCIRTRDSVGRQAWHLRQRALRPVAQFEYVEWTPDNHLRHSSFIALKENRDAREVRREGDAR
jgi:ATP-dependent DNA ligase